MRVRFLFSSVLAIGTAIPTILMAAEQVPRIVHWTERRGTASYQGLRRSFGDLGGGLVRVNITLDPQGKARSFVDLKCDGQPKSVQATEPGPAITLSCRAVDPRTTEFTFLRTSGDGWVRSSGREQVSPDGATMTVSAVQTDAKGAVVARGERIFDRQR